MLSRKFGQLDEQVSLLGFGAASLSGSGGGYGFGPMSDDDGIALVRAALSSGVNLYDTAPIYGFGESERRLGLALKGRRDEAFLVSKCGVAYDDRKRVRIDNSPKTTQHMLEGSLRRLQTEMIDLYMVHWPDDDVDIRHTVETMAKAKERGLIRYVGLSNTNPDDLSKARQVCAIDVVQLQASFLAPEALDALAETEDLSQVGVMSWGTLAKGILTGRVDRDRTFDPSDARHSEPWWVNADHEPHFAVMDALVPFLADLEHTGLELALGYLHDRKHVDTLLCGVRNLGQLYTAVEALQRLPSSDVIAEAVAIRDQILDTYAP